MTYELKLEFSDRQVWYGKFLEEYGSDKNASNSYSDMINYEFRDAKGNWNDEIPRAYIIIFKSEDDKLKFIMKYL